MNRIHVRDAEIVNVPFWAALAGCSARRCECRVASHTSEQQRCNAPASAAQNGTLAFSASLSPSVSTQDGRTLIELMISITIGLMISGLVVSLFLRSHSSYRLHDENGRMREDGNFALMLLKKNIVQSGFSPIAASMSNQPIQKTTYLPDQGIRGCEHGFSAGMSGDFSCARNAGGFPAIEVIYVVDKDNSKAGAGTDCNGQRPQFNINGEEFNSDDVMYVMNRFFLHKKRGDTFASLYCAGNGNAISQPILSNVENFSISYSFDSNNDQTPDGYVKASKVTDYSADQQANWKNIIGVMICFQVASDNKILGATVQKYSNCAGEETLSNDKRLRSVFRSVFALRNNASSSFY